MTPITFLMQPNGANRSHHRTTLPAPNHGQPLANLLEQVPGLLALLTSKELVSLQATSSTLRQTLTNPDLWQSYLFFRTQMSFKPPKQTPPPPPPPLHPRQHFFQQCAIWYDVHQPPYPKCISRQPDCLVTSKNCWIQMVQQSYPVIYQAWYQREQQRQQEQAQRDASPARRYYNYLTSILIYTTHLLVLTQLFRSLYLSPHAKSPTWELLPIHCSHTPLVQWSRMLYWLIRSLACQTIYYSARLLFCTYAFLLLKNLSPRAYADIDQW